MWSDSCYSLSPIVSTLTLSVIVPFHRNLVQLEACLRAIRTSVPGAQLIVVADGAFAVAYYYLDI